MSKLKLLGMVTDPNHHGDKWEGATIYVVMDHGERRIKIKTRISSNILIHFQPGDEEIERLMMKNIERGLDAVQKDLDVDPKDINTIYEIVRLKMQRFVHKSAIRSSYLWNAITGEIREEEE